MNMPKLISFLTEIDKAEYTSRELILMDIYAHNQFYLTMRQLRNGRFIKDQYKIPLGKKVVMTTNKGRRLLEYLGELQYD